MDGKDFLLMIGYILYEQPQFEKEAKEYAEGWIALLMKNPVLASECVKWNDFWIGRSCY